MADDLRAELAGLRAEVSGLSRAVRELTRAGRSQAEAIAAGDAADAERVVALRAAVDALAAKVDALRPAADYFAGRFKAEGKAEADRRGALAKLGTAGAGMASAVLGDAKVRTLVVAAVIAALTGWLGLATGVAGKAQVAYSGETADAAP